MLSEVIIKLLKDNYKAALWGMVLTPVFFYLISVVLEVSLYEHLNYLMREKEKRQLFVEQLDELNSHLKDYEAISFKKQERLWEILKKHVDDDKDLSEALGIANRNQDVIRALFAFGEIYASLVEMGEHSPGENFKCLNKLYEALSFILKHDQEGGSLDEAYDLLEEVYHKTKDFPVEVKDEARIEILRYLSYCAAKSNIRERKNKVVQYNERAARIMDDLNASLLQDPIIYRQKYYWIHFVKFITLVNSGNGKEVEAEACFENLKTWLDHDFLKTKMLQHEDKISYKNVWKRFKNKLTTSS